ncbi:MAG: sigma-70 family RNA polymerase sigma factor [Leucobacter sp.]|nr:sigma-70 family RNA polymerase sigma factor [Leucobacter sp.]
MPTSNDEWIGQLTAEGRTRDRAIRYLRDLLLKAAAHQVHRLALHSALGSARTEEVIHSAANEATVAVMAKLHTFEGRSRFTTWAFKFGILHANAEARKAQWKGRELAIDEYVDLPAETALSPDSAAEASDLQRAVARGLETALTSHQRSVATALLLHDVPIDVFAERTGATRGAVYKTLHDARKRLRQFLADEGFLTETEMDAVMTGTEA